MTEITVQNLGDKSILLHSDLEKLLALARRHEAVNVHLAHEDLSTIGLMRLAEAGESFSFWDNPEEDIYTSQDGEAV